MNPMVTIKLTAVNAMGVLPRIALLFSRRRLTISHLHMDHVEASGLAHLQISVRCDLDTAEQLSRQLRRLVELVEVCLHVDDVPRSAKAA